MKVIILSFLLLANTVVYGNKSITNGCGPANEELYQLVPDKVKVLGIDFTSACNLHDLCYGNHFPYLKDEIGLNRSQYQTNREQRIYCDDAFKDRMKKQCSTLPLTEKTLCHSIAMSYFTIVIASGWLFFKKDPVIKEQPLRFNDFFSLEETKSDLGVWGAAEANSSKKTLSKWFPKETSSNDKSSSEYLKPQDDHGWGAALDQMPVE